MTAGQFLRSAAFAALAFGALAPLHPTDAAAKDYRGCESPTPPELAMLRGEVTTDDLSMAYRELTAYQAANRRYRQCLEEVGARRNGSPMAVDLYNSSLEHEKELAKRFNRHLSEARKRS